ncbi:transcription antitermination factor NusB [Alkalilimnicola ehrlichii]|uniref:transcription antitermination factor NusB n=1 Tax=Alkalilimnicola ehrlichii TaxID=351052 RepID=UPI00268ACA9C|nr:transcription antitermination factor NusB [Alkalilimnicola ehrlichii]
MEAREAVAKALERVLERGQSVNEVLPALQAAVPAKDRGLVQALTYGVLRGYLYWSAIADRLLDKPLRRKDADIRCLLLSGLFEAGEMRTPDHAVVSATAGAARALKKNGRWG